jgi:hypothetical protein
MVHTILVGAVALVGVLAPRLSSDASAYYPTQPGDTWTYESSVRGQFTNQVVESVQEGESVTVRILGTDASGREQTFMVRKAGPRLYLGPDSESMTLLSDFSLEVGASTPTRAGAQEPTLTIGGRHEALDVFGTRFEDVVEVRVAQASGATAIYYFARGVGMVGMESDYPSVQVRLVTATVDGETVPPIP